MKEKNKSGKCQTIATWIGEKVTTMDTAAGADKGAAVEQVRRRLGFWKEQVLAMGNAADEVKQVCDEVTGTSEEDGVARILEQVDRYLHKRIY